MTNLHYIADEQLGGVEREYAEVEREAETGDYVFVFGREVCEVYGAEYGGSVWCSYMLKRLDGAKLVSRFEADDLTPLDPTGNVRIDGTVYRMVDRNAAVGDIVLITDEMDYNEDNYGNGVVFTVADLLEGYDGLVSTEENISLYDEEYVVLEPIDHDITQSADLSLTESDVRNNPRQVIDLIANLAGRLSKLESKVALTDDRVSRLGTANQQAYDIVARNVETWAQEMAELKARMGDAGRALTAEERREL